MGANRVFQQRYTLQAKPGRDGRRLTHMVRLDCARSQQHIGAFTQRIGCQEFEFAQLVAAHRHRCEVITFDENIATQIVGKPWQMF